MRHVNYAIIEDGPKCLLLQDIGPWDQFLTVTNGAERVVAEVAKRLGNRRLEYIDSGGERAKIIVKDGRFAGFIIAEGGCHEHTRRKNRLP